MEIPGSADRFHTNRIGGMDFHGLNSSFPRIWLRAGKCR